MADRKALVLVNGQVSELPAGDTLEGAGGGSATITSNSGATSYTLQEIIDKLVIGQHNVLLTFPTNSSYTIDEYAAFPYEIQTATVKNGAGTCTLNIAINGTSVTGLSAIAATTTQGTSTATAANAVAAGNRVTITLSSVSGVDTVALTIKYRRI
jgi:hypothetical protein